MFGLAFDCETDGLQATRLHCLVLEDRVVTKIDVVKDIFTEQGEFACHNLHRYDVPTLERLGNFKFHKNSLLIDTLALSWYLFPLRAKHGLADWGMEFGIPKPVIDDWENLTQEEYIHRCVEDTKITRMLWHKQYAYLKELYGSDTEIKKFIRYISFKMTCARLQEESRWKFNRKLCTETIAKLEVIKQEKFDELQGVMPPVPIVVSRKPPSKLYKANGELSEIGSRWRDLTESKGLPIDHAEPIDVIKGYDEPNPNSHEQLKEWLFGLGWKPRTFKTNDNGTEIPQINKQKQDGGGVCESIKELAETYPELSALDGYFVLGHRLGILRGFLRDASSDDYLVARIAGLTNTLRFKHSELVNLPGVEAVYGKEIRGCLVAPEGYELLGSDMSSLEDRTKQHYQFPFDPEYVLEQSKPDFDPHLDLALSDNALTLDQVAQYKAGTILSGVKPIRNLYKAGNYSCTYGAGPPKIAKTIGGTLQQGKQIHGAFWKRNWSLKAIAKACRVKTVQGQKWIFNPVSKFWYSLREEKDRFSTLNQGTGVYCFDTFVYLVLQKRRQLTAQFHDEIVLCVKKGYREEVKSFLNGVIEQVNNKLKLNRRLDIGIEFGDNYASVH